MIVLFLEAIYHRAHPPFAYAYDKDSVHLQLRTKKEDIQSVKCLFGDPFLWIEGKWHFEKLDMEKAGSDEHFDYWHVNVKPKTKRLRYGFELQNDNQTIIYTEQGFHEEIPLHDISPYFCFPYLHEQDLFHPPDWVKNTIWYQIFPERFANGCKENDPERVQPWGEALPSVDNFFGGDLAGIIEKLDYLTELGINGIYLTPIFQARSNHKYDTINYMEIDPHFGDKDTLKRLISKCHENGIKVMLDAVFNHCGFDFPPFQDVIKNGEKSKYKDWFYVQDFPVTVEPSPNYETFSFEKKMPKLNTSHPDVKKYLLDVARYWIQEFDIDGWRLDVANEIDHSFWREFRKAVKEVKEDVFIVGEVWHDSLRWLHGDQFDSVMNYPFTKLMRLFFLTNEISPSAFVSSLVKIRHSYPCHVNEVLFNIVGSHDTERILTSAKEQKEKVKLLFAFLFTYPGTPCIYYGDEIGLTGYQDPDCRKCMPWDQEKHDQDLFSFIKKLIELRKTYSLLQDDGKLSFITTPDEKNSLLFTKENEKGKLIVVMNNSEHEQTLQLPFSLKNQTLRDLWTDDEFRANADTLNITLSPFSFSFLYRKE